MPLRLHVYLSPSDELTKLRREIDELKSEVQKYKDSERIAVFRYGMEVTINTRILDYCRDNGIKLPRELLIRPQWGDED